MKPYFAKLLPIEEEIKAGDIALKPAFTYRNFADTMDIEQPAYIEEVDQEEVDLGKLEGVKKVKLFLCSKDIQVGDIAHYDGDHSIKWTVERVYSRSFRSGDAEIDSRYVYKVIGEISLEAIWVKEGNEFDEEDIMTYIMGDNYYMGVAIKCPICKVFH